MPDGRRVVTSSWAGRGEELGWASAVTIWDPQTGRDLRTIGPATDYSFQSFAVSPDGSSIALGGNSEPSNSAGPRP